MKNVLLVHSGDITRPDEADTLQASQEIGEWIEKLPGYHFLGSEPYLDMRSFLQSVDALKPDIIFNLVENINGTDAIMYQFSNLLDYLNVIYTGCKTPALIWSSDKLMMKRLLSWNNLATPDYLMFDDIEKKLSIKHDYIVKSRTEHASLGLDEASIHNNKNDLAQCINEKKEQYGGHWFAEQYIEGREVNVTLLEIDGKIHLFPIYEIEFDGYQEGQKKIVDYAQKWEDEDTLKVKTLRKFLTEKKDAELLHSLKNISYACWNAISLTGYARIDYRIDHSGKPWIIDINANPCLTSDAGFMATAMQEKITPEKVIHHILISAEKNHAT